MSTNKYWHTPNNREIKLSSRELRDISQEISDRFAPEKTHPMLELVALPVDPYLMYVYWNLDASVLSATKTNVEQAKLTLRVYWWPEETKSLQENKLWFDVPIEHHQHHCQIRLPIDETAYSCSLGWCSGDASFKSLVNSNLIRVPRGRMAADPQIIKKSESLLAAKSIAQKKIESNHQIYNESRVDDKIRQALVEKGHKECFPHLQLTEQKPIDDKVHKSLHDEALIDYQIKKTLHQKGIVINHLDETILTSKSAVSKSAGLSNNPSGRNTSR